MKRIREIIAVKLLKIAYMDVTPLRYILLVWGFLLGVWLLFNPTAFDTDTVWRIIARYGSEAVWGVVMILTSILTVLSCLKKSKTIDKLNYSFLIIVWGTIDIGRLIANPTATSTISYLMPVIMSAWVLLSV